LPQNEICGHSSPCASSGTPSTYIFVEQRASLDGLDAHVHTPHFTEFFAALGEVLAGPPAGSISEVSSTQTLDEAFAATGIAQ
jgi:quinol monooxygenase YgiN